MTEIIPQDPNFENKKRETIRFLIENLDEKKHPLLLYVLSFYPVMVSTIFEISYAHHLTKELQSNEVYATFNELKNTHEYLTFRATEKNVRSDFFDNVILDLISFILTALNGYSGPTSQDSYTDQNDTEPLI